MRVILNRYETRTAARDVAQATLASESLPPGQREKIRSALKLRPSQLGIYLGRHRGDGTIGVALKDLEKSAKALAEADGHPVPPDAGFRVGVDAEGQVAGCCWQWYVNEEGPP
jgi:hypothetical protein